MYYIIYGFLFIISLLPLPVLYLISNFISFIVFRIFGYRRKVIEENLATAFPNKSELERKIISHQFHRNFTDTFIETLKSLSASKKFYDKHCSANFDSLDELYREGISSQIHGCHQFNWEWLSLYFSTKIKQTFLAVYMPIANKAIDKIFYDLRTKNGGIFLPATDMKNSFEKWRNQLHTLVLVADQNPAIPHKSFWLNFFGKPTAFVTGPEKNAREKKCAVVFAKSIKKGRGKYEIEFEIITKDASLLPEGEITYLYRNYIEKTIQLQPEIYLWSHRRWKHPYHESYITNWVDKDDKPPIV